MERDKTAEFKQRFYAISTHTLTWSVTGVTTSQQMIESISTHTLTWSVTVCKQEIEGYFKDFNSHAHVERD